MNYRIQKRKRNRVNHSIRLILFSFLFALILSFLCFGNHSIAKNDSEAPLYKYYTNVEVQYGDTLWELAARYCDDSYSDYNEYIEEVMFINRMSDTRITAGSYLILPYHSEEYLP